MRTVVIFSLSVIITMTVSFAGLAQYNSSNDLVNFDSQIRSLFNMHQNYLSGLFRNDLNDVDEFDRTFFSDIKFVQNIRTAQFFDTVKSSVENGSPAKSGLLSVSYVKMTSINGKLVGVNYRYLSDGNNITLIRGSYNNGNILKAVYRYDLKGKLLNAKEFKGNKIISQKSHKLTI